VDINFISQHELNISASNNHPQNTHPFNGPFSGTTRESRYQKGKTNLDFTEARDSEWQWHQLGDMQVCTSLQTDNHASTPPLSFFTGRMPFLPPNQQRQSTEGKTITRKQVIIRSTYFNASTAFGTATGTVEKKPPAKPASGGVFIGGCIHHTICKSLNLSH